MTRKFKLEVTVDVEEFYEMEIQTAVSKHCQRDGSYTDYKNETKIFLSFNDACKWVKENPNTKVLSFVLICNKMKQLEMWTAKTAEESNE